MFNPVQSKNEILGIINSALTMLDRYPDSDDTNINISFNANLNPFLYLFEILKNMVGYDKMINILSWAIIEVIPVLEVSTKAVLIGGLKNIFSCEVNPFITKKILRDGIVVDLSTIDVVKMLNFSPLYTDSSYSNPKLTDALLGKFSKNGKVNPGKYLYFGCDDMECADDVKYSKDFNAFLWYVKNHPNTRNVWHSSFRKRDEIKKLRSENRKQRRTDGILTLEYVDSSSNLTDAEGNKMNVQVPFNNCLHVFIGNAKEIENNQEIRDALTIDLNVIKYSLKELNDSKEILKKYIDKLYTDYNETLGKEVLSDEDFLLSDKIDEDINTARSISNAIFSKDNQRVYKKIPFLPQYISNAKKFDSIEDCPYFNSPNSKSPDYIEINGEYYTLKNSLASRTKYSVFFEREGNDVVYKFKSDGNVFRISDDAFFANETEYNRDIKDIESQLYLDNLSPEYRDVKLNYYLYKTLLQFNIDFLSTIQLYNRETILAETIDSLTRFFSCQVNFDIKQKIVEKEIEKMIKNVIEKNETTVSDCFFTFSNEEYDDMLKQTELERLGVYSDENGITNGKKIDPQVIANILNKATDGSSKVEDITKIETLLSEMGDYLSSTTVSEQQTDYNINVKFDFIEKFWLKFIERLLWNVLTPKVYMIIALNMNLMGITSSHDMLDFILSHKKVLVSLIRTMINDIINEILKIALKLIGDLFKQVAFKLSMEQVLYYKELLKKCMDCIKFEKGTVGYTLEEAGADIYDLPDEAPINKEC